MRYAGLYANYVEEQQYMYESDRYTDTENTSSMYKQTQNRSDTEDQQQPLKFAAEKKRYEAIRTSDAGNSNPNPKSCWSLNLCQIAVIWFWGIIIMILELAAWIAFVLMLAPPLPLWVQLTPAILLVMALLGQLLQTCQCKLSPYFREKKGEEAMSFMGIPVDAEDESSVGCCGVLLVLLLILFLPFNGFLELIQCNFIETKPESARKVAFSQEPPQEQEDGGAHGFQPYVKRGTGGETGEKETFVPPKNSKRTPIPDTPLMEPKVLVVKGYRKKGLWYKAAERRQGRPYWVHEKNEGYLQWYPRLRSWIITDTIECVGGRAYVTQDTPLPTLATETWMTPRHGQWTPNPKFSVVADTSISE